MRFTIDSLTAGLLVTCESRVIWYFLVYFDSSHVIFDRQIPCHLSIAASRRGRPRCSAGTCFLGALYHARAAHRAAVEVSPPRPPLMFTGETRLGRHFNLAEILVPGGGISISARLKCVGKQFTPECALRVLTAMRPAKAQPRRRVRHVRLVSCCEFTSTALPYSST